MPSGDARRDSTNWRSMKLATPGSSLSPCSWSAGTICSERASTTRASSGVKNCQVPVAACARRSGITLPASPQVTATETAMSRIAACRQKTRGRICRHLRKTA